MSSGSPLPASPSPSPTSLWLVDRSRYESGLSGCLFARYLEYHYGPTGYGIVRKAQSIPLATGGAIHDGLAEVLQWVQANAATETPLEVIRTAATTASAAYRATVEAKGFRNLTADTESLDTLLLEQSALIEGLIWAWCLVALPPLLASQRIVTVEEEEVPVLGCTCGLAGTGAYQDHQARGCTGVGWMTRLDILTQYRDRPDTYAYHEFKTASYTQDADAWETKIQFGANRWGPERRLGIEVSEAWVHVLHKGKREGRDYDAATKRSAGPIIQKTPLCYGYRRPAQPPVVTEDWQAEYAYVDSQGKNRKLTRDYQRAGIWELRDQAGQDDLSPVEYWVRSLGLPILAKSLQLVGPLNRQREQLADLEAEIVHHEIGWQETLWRIHDAAPETLADPIYRIIPRSWDCRQFGARHRCQFEPICFKHEGWEDPVGSGLYLARRPHHQPELDQAIARGLLVEETAEAEEN